MSKIVNYNFDYNPDKNFISLIENLPFEVLDDKDFWMIFIKDNDKKKSYNISSDCRIAAMILSCIWYNLSSFIVPKHNKMIEIEIPKNCIYLTLDLGKEYEKYEIHRKLGDLQGQWLVLNDSDNKYYGLVKEGLINKNLDEWKISYMEKVINKVNNFNNKSNYKPEIGILSCLIKLNKLNTTIVNFNNLI